MEEKEHWHHVEPRHNREKLNPHTIPLQERIVGAEQLDIYEHLNDMVQELRAHLYRVYPIPDLQRAKDAADSLDKSLIHMANLAREFGVHHSHYHVGGVLIGKREPTKDDPNPWVVLFDANTKVDDDGHPTREAQKWCAEQYLLDRADPKLPGKASEKMKECYVFVLAAEPRSVNGGPIGFYDDKSQKTQPTFTPCSDLCCPRIHDYIDRKDGFLDPKVEILTANVASGENAPLRKYQNAIDAVNFHRKPEEVLRETRDL